MNLMTSNDDDFFLSMDHFGYINTDTHIIRVKHIGHNVVVVMFNETQQVYQCMCISELIFCEWEGHSYICTKFNVVILMMTHKKSYMIRLCKCSGKDMRYMDKKNYSECTN